MFKNVNFFVTIKNDMGDVVIRRIKLERQAQIKLTSLFVQSSKALFELDRVDFDGSYKPDPGEAHVISNFSISGDILQALKAPSSVKELELNTTTPPKIVSVFTGTYEPLLVAFQKFDYTQFITSKGISLFNSNDTFHLLKGFGLNIQERVDCFFSQGNLVFQSFFIARQIFDLTMYYREATKAELSKFIENPKISVEDKEVFNNNSDSWVRRKVAIINDSNYLDKYSASQICEKAVSYGLVIKKKREGRREKIVLPKDKKELKVALRFLDEEIYKGPFSETTYLTNSKRKFR